MSKKQSILLGSTAITFDDHFTFESMRPLEKEILSWEPDAKSVEIKYPTEVEAVGALIVTTTSDSRRAIFFTAKGKKVERFGEQQATEQFLR